MLSFIREISGLSGPPHWMIHKAWWTFIAAGGLTGLALGLGASYLWPTAYTAEVQLYVQQPTIPRNLLVSGDAFDLDGSVSDARAAAFSFNSLTELGQRGYYRHLRAGKEIDAMREEMTRALRVERSGDVIRVAFTYRDYSPNVDNGRKAVELANRFASAIIDTNLRRQEMQIVRTVEFFNMRAQHAALSWEKLNREIRGLTAADPRFDRLALDRELARKEYESVKQKLSEAEALRDLAIRQMGWRLLVLDGAQPPQGPDVSRLRMALSGLGCGLLAGLIAWLLVAMRSAPSVSLGPEAASSN
jgi:uncharacterized protein involved in exopolysaccharide biosynthesis